MKDCSKKYCILSIIAVFLFMFGYDWLIHGTVIVAMYLETASVWRPEETMQAFFPYCLLYHLTLATIFTYTFFTWAKKIFHDPSNDYTIEKYGKEYGVFIGLIMGIVNASFYIVLPIPFTLALAWFAASLGQGIGVAYVLIYLYNKKNAAK